MKKICLILLILILIFALVIGGMYGYLHYADGGFCRNVPQEEKEQRMQIVTEAQNWLGAKEGSHAHTDIIDIYNSHTPLAQDYTVTLEDNWCAAYASAVAISCGMTDIIPTECGCQRQIGLWETMGQWVEDDNYMPLPGDYIYYSWDEEFSFRDCTGWSNHVGIVVGTKGPFIKVIEGNKSDSVSYRILLRGHHQIRGYGIPDYDKIP